MVNRNNKISVKSKAAPIYIRRGRRQRCRRRLSLNQPYLSGQLDQ